MTTTTPRRPRSTATKPSSHTAIAAELAELVYTCVIHPIIAGNMPEAMVERFKLALAYIKDGRLGTVLPLPPNRGFLMKNDGSGEFTPEAMAWLENLHAALQAFTHIRGLDNHPLASVKVRSGRGSYTDNSSFPYWMSTKQGDGLWLADHHFTSAWIARVEFPEKRHLKFKPVVIDILLEDFRPDDGGPNSHPTMFERKIEKIIATISQRAVVLPGNEPAALVKKIFAGLAT